MKFKIHHLQFVQFCCGELTRIFDSKIPQMEGQERHDEVWMD